MYYLGFLKTNTKDVVIFKSIKKPHKKDYNYFTGVMGPYGSEVEARKSLSAMRGRGYRANPAKYMSDKQALALTKKMIAVGKKLLKHERSEIRRNPEEKEHVSQFLHHMKTLEKYALGSKPYIETLAKAYEHMQAVKKKA
jgi:hypothetical protein